MTSAMYLEHYLDSLEGLPKELQRNFSQMRSLDTRSQQLSCQIDNSVEDYLNKVKVMEGEGRKKCLLGIQSLFDRNKKFADQKVQLAMHTYELVDRHIRRLDADLARFEAEMKERPMACVNSSHNNSNNNAGGNHASNSNGKNNSSKSGSCVGLKERMRKRKRDGYEMEKKKRKKNGGLLDVDLGHSPSSSITANSSSLHHPMMLSASDPTSEVLEMPVDPNEPTYCTCHQVSYGEMIGCDNPDCPIEWFHFGCVGLSTKPKGRWFCGRCLSERRKKT